MKNLTESMEPCGVVLVVDDSKVDRQIISLPLINEGLEVIEANGGEQAIALAHNRRPDVIISDMMMPGMDGLELCRHIRASSQTQDIFFIMMTSLGDADARLAGLKVGCDEYLHKPIMPEEVLLRVSASIRYRRQRQELADKNARLTHVLGQVHRQQEDLAQDITMARRVQRALLPERPLSHKGYEFGYFLEPSDLIGGDYLDLIPWGEEKVGLIEADVSGHGIPAAIVTGMFHAWVHAELHPDTDLEQFFIRLNRYIFEHTLPEMYMTAFVSIMDLRTGAMDYVLAGHPEPLIFTGERPVLLPPAATPAVGLYPDIVVSRSHYRLRKGADFFIFSDGLWDCFSDANQGRESLLPALIPIFASQKRSEGLKWFFYEAVRAWGDRPPVDDVAILFLHREE